MNHLTPDVDAPASGHPGAVKRLSVRIHHVYFDSSFGAFAIADDGGRWRLSGEEITKALNRDLFLPMAAAPKDREFLAIMHDGRTPPNPFHAIIRWNDHGNGKGAWMEGNGCEFREDAEEKGSARPLGWMELPPLIVPESGPRA